MAPPVESALLAEWDDAAATGRLLLQRCPRCSAVQAYVRALCSTCHYSALGFIEASGQGEIETYTWVHRAAFDDVTVPYAIARVRLVEGARLLTAIVEVEEGDIACGDEVHLRWRNYEEGRRLPVFAPLGRREGV